MYYKCVNYHLESLVVGVNPNFAVQYKIGEWVKPKMLGTKLMVFDNEKRAKFFGTEIWSGRVYECEIINPIQEYDLFLYFMDIRYGYSVTIIKLLKELNRRIKSKKRRLDIRTEIKDYLSKSPHYIPQPNTVYCDAVKITKKI